MAFKEPNSELGSKRKMLEASYLVCSKYLQLNGRLHTP